jgi:hypothetical protein
MTIKPKNWAKSALEAVRQAVGLVLPLMNRRNISIMLGIATLFGVVAPETATDVRNVIFEPVGVEQSAGDLL